MQIQKLKLGQQNNDAWSINLAGANKKATLKCKKIIIKTLAKLFESVYCHSTPMIDSISHISNKELKHRFAIHLARHCDLPLATHCKVRHTRSDV